MLSFLTFLSKVLSTLYVRIDYIKRAIRLHRKLSAIIDKRRLSRVCVRLCSIRLENRRKLLFETSKDFLSSSKISVRTDCLLFLVYDVMADQTLELGSKTCLSACVIANKYRMGIAEVRSLHSYQWVYGRADGSINSKVVFRCF